ncbi:MAG: DUF2330 domain-containing protein [Bacteroidia bacterium]
MKHIFFTLFAATLSLPAMSFCGFYVAKADATLFNKASQVVVVRNGERSTITMSSDFQGDVKDFAMVIPVPVVLKKADVKVVDRILFDKLDAYSAPRLVEYYDNNPCWVDRHYDSNKSRTRSKMMVSKAESVDEKEAKKDYKVTIVEQYTVGEYDILILSAEESSGLERWLTDNGYKIPGGAKEVLDPYIKSNMKFFVAKVNLGEHDNGGAVPLRPIQISFNSPKFMLPIRLGMANAVSPQDMIVYAFSKNGRIETTNYRTVPVPTGQKVPLFVQQEFGPFYKELYTKAWTREGKNIVSLEYAWDVSMNQTVFCDPCVGPPPMLTEFQQAGVDWLQTGHYGNIEGTCYFTRLHVTYDRINFPQDLMFQETPNKQNFQARYVLTHPAQGSFDCDEAQAYLRDLGQRRWNELYTYQWLTGNSIEKHRDYATEYDKHIKHKKSDDGKRQGGMMPVDFSPEDGNGNTGNSMSVVVLSLISLSAIFFAMTRGRKTSIA